jgi:hypothetical protein
MRFCSRRKTIFSLKLEMQLQATVTYIEEVTLAVAVAKGQLSGYGYLPYIKFLI